MGHLRIGSGAAGMWNSAPMGCWHCRHSFTHYTAMLDPVLGFLFDFFFFAFINSPAENGSPKEIRWTIALPACLGEGLQGGMA